MLQDCIITPDQTQPVFPTPSDSIITYSEPIPPDCHGTHYSIALWDCRQSHGCAVGKREKAYADPGHRRWHGVSINTHVEYTGFDRTEGGLEVEKCHGQSTNCLGPCCNPCKLQACGNDVILCGSSIAERFTFFQAYLELLVTVIIPAVHTGCEKIPFYCNSNVREGNKTVLVKNNDSISKNDIQFQYVYSQVTKRS